jgi:mannose-6-phosphate isomerase-like protein (cupin superfamily)
MVNQQPVPTSRVARHFKEPVLVTHTEATRFLWGDNESHHVSDLVYGRGERISSVTFALSPGGYFKASKAWKPLYDQDRFYYVVEGTLAIHDPERGEVAVARAGEAIHWRGAKWHFGYNFGAGETLVLDWYAPQERPPGVSEVEFGKGKPSLEHVVDGRFDLLGRWPAALPETRDALLRDGGMVTLGAGEALHLIAGNESPTLVSLYISTDRLTAGTVQLRGGQRADPEMHPGDEVLYVLRGRLHVFLPDTRDWFEANPKDTVFLPEGTRHQYWNYGDQPVAFAFAVTPRYR